MGEKNIIVDGYNLKGQKYLATAFISEACVLSISVQKINIRIQA